VWLPGNMPSDPINARRRGFAWQSEAWVGNGSRTLEKAGNPPFRPRTGKGAVPYRPASRTLPEHPERTSAPFWGAGAFRAGRARSQVQGIVAQSVAPTA
jgi:hypothetical protein